MQITPNQRFRHGQDTFEPGETYDVDPGVGTYFVMAGWASSPDVTTEPAPQPEHVTLDVHDADAASTTEEVTRG